MQTRKVIQLWENLDLDILITCTYRSDEEQNALYEIGRSLPGKVVTNARAGESAHNATTDKGKPAACAFDFVPVLHGKPQWNTNQPEVLNLWLKAGAIAEKMGLEWYGNPAAKFREFPHVQMKNWRTRAR